MPWQRLHSCSPDSAKKSIGLPVSWKCIDIEAACPLYGVQCTSIHQFVQFPTCSASNRYLPLNKNFPTQWIQIFSLATNKASGYRPLALLDQTWQPPEHACRASQQHFWFRRFEQPLAETHSAQITDNDQSRFEFELDFTPAEIKLSIGHFWPLLQICPAEILRTLLHRCSFVMQCSMNSHNYNVPRHSHHLFNLRFNSELYLMLL